jgi:hypothetical protein
LSPSPATFFAKCKSITLTRVRACSNRRRALIGSWVTPPTTGSIEIEWGGEENITINHGCGGGGGGGGGESNGGGGDSRQR